MNCDDAAARAEAEAAAGVVRRLWGDVVSEGLDLEATADAGGLTWGDAARLRDRVAGPVPAGAAGLYRDLRYLAGLKREMEAEGGAWADPLSYGIDPLYDRLDFRLVPPDTAPGGPADAGWRVTYIGGSTLQA